MSTPTPPFAPHSLTLTLAVALCLSLAGCGGGGDDALTSDTSAAASDREDALAVRRPIVAGSNTLQVGITIAGFPHKVDVYRPVGATRAVVFLHGHGGKNWQIAYDLGLNSKMAPVVTKNVNWDWLSKNGIIAVFPQGQPAVGTSLPTWSNYVFDSGQDDVAFLNALSTYVKAQYGATSVALSGHSSGGTMTARMWCEGTTSFKAFVSMAGPMPSSTYPYPSPTCTPLAPAPYYMVVGGKDTKLTMFATGLLTPTQEEIAAGLTDSILVSEWRRHVDRSLGTCGESPSMQGASRSATGPTWNACSNRIRYTVVSNADHPIASLQQYAGVKMVDLVAGFSK